MVWYGMAQGQATDNVDIIMMWQIIIAAIGPPTLCLKKWTNFEML